MGRKGKERADTLGAGGRGGLGASRRRPDVGRLRAGSRHMLGRGEDRARGGCFRVGDVVNGVNRRLDAERSDEEREGNDRGAAPSLRAPRDGKADQRREREPDPRPRRALVKPVRGAVRTRIRRSDGKAAPEPQEPHDARRAHPASSCRPPATATRGCAHISARSPVHAAHSARRLPTCQAQPAREVRVRSPNRRRGRGPRAPAHSRALGACATCEILTVSGAGVARSPRGAPPGARRARG